jgi:chromosome segregation ATPase
MGLRASDKKIASLVDGMNKVIKSQNRLQEEFDEQDEQLAEIKKANQRQNRQLDELLEGEKDIRERLDASPQTKCISLSSGGLQ